MPLDPDRLEADLLAQLDALSGEFVQAVLLDIEYLLAMLHEGGKQANKRTDQAAARAAA